MATSLISGLLDNGFKGENIRVADVDPHALACQFPVRVYQNNVPAIVGADVVVLAVKPQILAQVSRQLKSELANWPTKKPWPLFISIAAGVRLADLVNWLGFDDLPVIRVMPNTASLVRCGASGLFASKNVSDVQCEIAENILRSVGLAVWLEEEPLLDAVTALSGSGPAYFFKVMEIMAQVGQDLGLSAEVARLLTLQTAFGAAKMALESPEDVGILRQRVTSKGGTTEQALAVFEQHDLTGIFSQALHAAHQRSMQLAQELAQCYNQSEPHKMLDKNSP